jgi:hypothetical protein
MPSPFMIAAWMAMPLRLRLPPASIPLAVCHHTKGTARAEMIGDRSMYFLLIDRGLHFNFISN